MNALLLAMIIQYSGEYNIEPKLVTAVIQNESSFNVKARGKHGEIGLMQLLPSTFPGYTDKQLEDPRMNIKLGVKYLAEVKKECPHTKEKTWLICFNLGPYKAKKVKHPKLFPYYKKVMGIMKARQLASRKL